jgi:hypothetical protein
MNSIPYTTAIYPSLTNPHPTQNQWLAVPKDVWGLIFRQLSFVELKKLRLVVKLFNQAFKSPIAGENLLKMEEVNLHHGEGWWQTFSRRKILIAVDVSVSMRDGAEGWRLSAAAREAKSIFRQYHNLAEMNKVTLMPFGINFQMLSLRSENQVDESLGNAIDNANPGNNWSRTLKGIDDFVEINKDFRVTIFLLSDMDCVSKKLESHYFWKKIFSQEVNIKLCRIGNSTSGLGIYEKLMRMSLVDSKDAAEPAVKKAKIIQNLILTGKSILSEPQVVIEEIQPEVDEVVFELSDEDGDYIDYGQYSSDDL